MSVVSTAWLLWMALTVLAHWVAPERVRGAVVPLATAAFLAWLAPVSLVVLIAMATVAYVGASRFANRPGFVCAAVVALLFWVKLPIHAGVGEPLLILGLAYYALRCIHYVLDASQGRLPPHGPEALIRYLFFLPTLIAGPIHRFGPFARELRRQRWDSVTFSQGCERILFGYVKISVIGNFLIAHRMALTIAPLRITHPALFEYLDCVRYGGNLYAQFAGYSDIAIGFAMLLGHRVMENFDRPFFRENLTRFWESWHMSLTSFCRDYIYMPMLAMTRKSWLAVIASMLALGCWHELSPRYVVWGGVHGAAILLWRRATRARGDAMTTAPATAVATPPTQTRFARWAGTLVTMNFVFVSFVITKEETLTASWAAFCRLVGVSA